MSSDMYSKPIADQSNQVLNLINQSNQLLYLTLDFIGCLQMWYTVKCAMTACFERPTGVLSVHFVFYVLYNIQEPCTSKLQLQYNSGEPLQKSGASLRLISGTLETRLTVLSGATGRSTWLRFPVNRNTIETELNLTYHQSHSTKTMYPNLLTVCKAIYIILFALDVR